MNKRAWLMAAAMMVAAGGAVAQDKAVDKKPEAAAQPAAEMPKLMVGDKAPALTVSKWVRGEQVTGFEKGKTYVVEFWATWCGPCKVSIPHLAELQKANPEVKFIGVSVWENGSGDVDPFMTTETGKKMEYTVATDDVKWPEGGDRKASRKAASEGKMATTWMKASGSNGIPTAFIVNGDGKVSWIGHPMIGLDKALATSLSGKQDLAADAAKYKKRKSAEGVLEQAMKDGDPEGMIKAIDQASAADPEMGKELAGQKYVILMMQIKDYPKAYAFGNEIVDGAAKDNAQLLNQISWLIVDPDNKPEKQDLKLAEKAAARAVELTNNKDGMIMDTLAAVYACKGDWAKAAELQEKAVKLVGEDNQAAGEMKDRLEQYKKKAKSGGS